MILHSFVILHLSPLFHSVTHIHGLIYLFIYQIIRFNLFTCVLSFCPLCPSICLSVSHTEALRPVTHPCPSLSQPLCCLRCCSVSVTLPHATHSNANILYLPVPLPPLSHTLASCHFHPFAFPSAVSTPLLYLFPASFPASSTTSSPLLSQPPPSPFLSHTHSILYINTYTHSLILHTRFHSASSLLC